MKLLGLTFSKISIEKLNNLSNDLKINANIDIAEIKPLKQDFFKSKEEFIGIRFSYTLNYDPGIAKIEISGDLALSLEPKMAKELLRDWKENKKIMDEDFRLALFNIILKKSSLKALQLEEEMNLPSHIPFPTLRKEEPKK